MQQRHMIAGLLSALSLLLLGCSPLVIREAKSPAQTDAPNSIRTLGADQRFSTLSAQSVAQRLHASRADEPVNILALSGGGADGAFGAGAVAGLTRSGSRPQFSVVTGVSAGALIAPYAFLGPEWDQQLIDIYTTGRG